LVLLLLLLLLLLQVRSLLVVSKVVQLLLVMLAPQVNKTGSAHIAPGFAACSRAGSVKHKFLCLSLVV
jgi:hypothetical protein